MRAMARRLAGSAWASVRKVLSDRIGGPTAVVLAALGILFTKPWDWQTAVDVIRGVIPPGAGRYGHGLPMGVCPMGVCPGGG